VRVEPEHRVVHPVGALTVQREVPLLVHDLPPQPPQRPLTIRQPVASRGQRAQHDRRERAVFHLYDRFLPDLFGGIERVPADQAPDERGKVRRDEGDVVVVLLINVHDVRLTPLPHVR
jgi:hypothetical protein